MLEYITIKCTDLLLQASSPVSNYFEVDYVRDSRTLYQRFSFIKSIINNNEFAEAVHRIVSSPVTRWSHTEQIKDIRNVKRFTNVNLREVIKASRRAKIQDCQYLNSLGFDSLPEKINTIVKNDSIDTPENRFIKHALESFLKFCTDVNVKSKEFKIKKMENESEKLVRDLESKLSHSFFKQVSRPTLLKLNSPILQRKEGYREILRIWLMFDLAAKLIWTGGDDIYSGGKKDVATLYEYWLFFKLLELFMSIFIVKDVDVADLIKETPDGLNLK
jgi:predicted component of viral defense system (DUF524 family)